MKIVDSGLVICTGPVGAIGKYRSQTIHRLTLPGAHLICMNLVPGGDFLDRLVTTKRLKRDLRLKI